MGFQITVVIVVLIIFGIFAYGASLAEKAVAAKKDSKANLKK